MPTVTFPARCAVAVICGEHLISQVYPASVPIEAFIDDILELLDDELRRRGAACLDPATRHELLRTNGVRLDVTRTLDELGIEDGTALWLVPAAEGASFEPQYESLSTGLARIGKRLFAPVTDETALQAAIGILAMATLTICGLAIHYRVHDGWMAPVMATGTLGALLAVGAMAVRRWWPDRSDLLSGFAWLAVPSLATALASAAPGGVGAPHIFIAALAAAVLGRAVVTITQRWITTAAALVTLSAITGLVAGLRMWEPIPAQWLGMCTLIGLLVLVTTAPTLALWSAGIRPPHFGSVTGRDLFRRSEGLHVDAVSPVDEELGADANPDTTPRGADIAATARRSNGALTGICVAAAMSLPPAVWATLAPVATHGDAAAVLAVLFVVIFISRGRAFADRRQAVALVCGAALAVCAGVCRYVLDVPTPVNLVLGSSALIVFSGAGLVAALSIPSTRFTPLIRMVAEWLELVAIVVAFPLAAWISGLFAWVRMR